MTRQAGPNKNLVSCGALQRSDRWSRLGIALVATILTFLALVGLSSVAGGQETVLQEKGGQDQAVKTVAASEEASTETAATKVAKFDFSDGKVPESLDQLREMQDRFIAISQKVKEATVNVRVGQAQGSGVIVTRDGYVLTAAHVVGEANRPAIIQLPDGTELKARTLGLNRFVDSGLLKISNEGKYPYLDMGESASLKLGQWVMAIGHPGGWDEDRGLVIRVGRIIALRRNAIDTDCTLVGGDSGGPLVDMDGAVIGIHSRIGDQLDENWHVPVDTYLDTWDRLVKGEDWGSGVGGVRRPYIGISFKSDSLEIDTVPSGGPGDKAGLKVGDVVVEFDGVKLDSLERMQFAFARVSIGQVVKVRYKRGEEEHEVELTVGVQRR